MTKRTTVLFEDYDPSNLNEWDDVLPYEFVIKESAGNDETTCPASLDEIYDYLKVEEGLTRKVKLTFVRTAEMNGVIDPATRGATYITLHWSTDSAIDEPDGEPMLHEWLHSLQWAVENWQKYPEGLAGDPDGGRMIGEERDLENADPCYRRDPEKEKSWIGLYRHILQTHMTRKMLREAATRRASAGRGVY